MTILDVSGPHFEQNEDGKTFEHPGYIETRCYVCGAKIFTVITSPTRFDLCGRNYCVRMKV